MILKSSYDQARTSQRDNLEDGVEKLSAMIKGMATVAYRIDDTEAKNTITDQGKVNPEVQEPKVEESSDPFAIPAAIGVGYYPGWLVAQLSKSALTPACTAAAVSSSLWLTVMPDDTEIDKAASAWQSAGTEIEAIGRINDLMNLSKDAWGDDARRSFDRWVNNFQTELNQAQDAASGRPPGSGGISGQLKDTVEEIGNLQGVLSLIQNPI